MVGIDEQLGAVPLTRLERRPRRFGTICAFVYSTAEISTAAVLSSTIAANRSANVAAGVAATLRT